MEDREMPNMDRYNKLTNNWNYDASSVLISLSDLENFRCLIFASKNVLTTVNQFKTFPLLLQQ
jgi:hypothetical protein